MRIIREEEIESEKNSNYGVTTHDSFNFKDVWSFNHPHLSVKDRMKKLHRVEVLVERGEFQVF